VPSAARHIPEVDRLLVSYAALRSDAETRVYASPDPLDFGVHDDRYLLVTLAIAAPEIVQHDDRLYVACLRPALNGIRMAPLRFAPRQW
jgi:hypothetical protein